MGYMKEIWQEMHEWTPEDMEDSSSIFAQEDGQGFSCIMYFTMTEETAAAFRGEPDKLTPGMKLFSEFCK